MKYILCLIFSAVLIISCSSDVEPKKDFNVNVRMSSDPGRLNPIAGNPTTQATEIIGLIFLPPAHYDPISYELSPIIVKEVPDPVVDENGLTTFTFEILPEAIWDDGQPVTGEDYLFTLKAALNPKVEAAHLRGILENASSVDIDQQNPKKFTVTIEEYFYIAQEAFSTFALLPRHIYDPENLMGKYAIKDLINAEESDSTLAQFATEFNSIKYSQETVSGCGPYKLKAWEIDQYIALERKEDYWGNAYPDRTLLHNNPSEITFRMIADDNAATTLLKDSSIDLMLVRDATVFDNLIKSENFEENFTVHTPKMFLSYYIGLNNRKPELADKDVRRALAHLVDVENIIETLDNGYGERMVGPMFSSSPMYNESLSLIEYNPKKAVEILEEEGWKDTNDNGIRDKVIDGELVELEIDYLASQSPLGQKVGLLFQDNAKQAGVAVKMEIKEGRAMMNAISEHNYEASASASRLSLSPYDPYQRWHSDNSTVRKGNTTGLVSDKIDMLIEKIRTTKDEEERKAAYLEFQEVIYEEQPVIFLYSPTQKFVLSNKFKGLFSEKRPGYFVGSFSKK